MKSSWGVLKFQCTPAASKKTARVLERGGSNSGEKSMTIICSLQFDIIDINTKYVVDKLGGINVKLNLAKRR